MIKNLLFKFSIIVCFIVIVSTQVKAQPDKQKLYKVLTLSGQKQGARDLPQDHGIAGAWQKLQKLATTASALQTQAHPDDEHADRLTYLSRGKGVRTALLSLNRGESGGNVLGVEFFDQLGLLRTEEFLLAASYYGLDDLYFTKLADYGFSKRVEEAYDKWGKQNVLAEIVRVIRINRPLVIISRFHGTTRDGHGNHQAAGEMSQVAFTMAGDPAAFPEQISKEGLRPWKALKLYRGGIRPAEHWNVQINTGEFSPWLGESYKNFSLLGYSLHRSQNGGHRSEVNGRFVQYYERLKSNVKSEEKETGFFDGIDTSITGIYSVTGEVPPPGVLTLLTAIAEDVNNALNAFEPRNLASIFPFLTSGLSNTRAAIRLSTNQPEARFMLQVKEQQFMDAINTVAGIQLQAMAVPMATKEKRSFYEPQPTMGFAVAGQPFKVEATLVNNSPVLITPKSIQLVTPAGWKVDSNNQDLQPLKVNDKTELSFIVTVPDNAPFTKPYFSRTSIQESQYKLQDTESESLPWSTPPLRISASYLINNELINIMLPVEAKQANLPYGYNQYTVKVAPAIGLNIQPATGIVPLNSKVKTVNTKVEVVNNFEGAINGIITLQTPAGWKVEPLKTPFAFTKAGEKSIYSIKVTMPAIEERIYEIKAIATANGKEYTQGYDLITHRDVDQSILYHPAIAMIKGMDVNVYPGLRIGYVMGVGDEVPAGLEQLGAKVHLLTSTDLATGLLSQYDVVMIGTRAYAVRQDLKTYNQRLLEYAKNGGHLIVLFQTPEFVPETMAPIKAHLPGDPEEVSEENSPVKILDGRHPVLNYPNKITSADFENWVEQRGSKFFSTWDTAYVPIISTQDIGQAPQQGGWLMAKYGKGHYTYCAYSFHRQLPYGVKGAYRIMANLISYGKK
ncbi:MAG: PIG-L family deacetylase [Segetibacter sp.]